MTGKRLRLLVGVLATAVIVLPLGWFWQQSLMPSTYSVMDMGTTTTATARDLHRVTRTMGPRASPTSWPTRRRRRTSASTSSRAKAP